MSLSYADEMLIRFREKAERIGAVEVSRAPGYFIDRAGALYSTRGGRSRCGFVELRQNQNGHGYVQYALSVDGKVRMARAHVLVLEAFVGPRPEGHVSRHLNGVKTDNRAENLAWGTQQQNIDDKRAHGTLATGARNGRALHPESTPRGEAVFGAKLDEAKVRRIKERIAAGEVPFRLAAEYGVRKHAIYAIRDGKSWRHV